METVPSSHGDRHKPHVGHHVRALQPKAEVGGGRQLVEARRVSWCSTLAISTAPHPLLHPCHHTDSSNIIIVLSDIRYYKLKVLSKILLPIDDSRQEEVIDQCKQLGCMKSVCSIAGCSGHGMQHMQHAAAADGS